MAKAKDPVCGMDVETSAARHATEHQGKRYYAVLHIRRT